MVKTIVAIGDSTTTDFSVSSPFRMFFKAWSKKENNWFIGGKSDKVIRSIFYRLNKKIDLRAINYSTPSSSVTKKSSLLGILMNKKDMSDQVNEILKEKEIPEVIFIWLGYSSLWEMRKSNSKTILENLRKEFEIQLERLIRATSFSKKKHKIIVLGLMRINDLFVLRDKASQKRQHNQRLFPYFDEAEKISIPIRKENRKMSVYLLERINETLQKIVKNCKKHENIQILYRDVRPKSYKLDLKYLSSNDCWHPSIYGQKKIADAIYRVTKKDLEFLKD